MKNTELGLSAPRQNLGRLIILRWLLMLSLLLGLGSARYLLDITLPYVTVMWLMGVFLVFNLLSWLRLQVRWPVTPVEFFLQILLDIGGVSVLFYFCGGATNPFVSYYLVPLTISVATLPWRYTWALALLSVACYTSLLFYNVPLPELHPTAGLDNNRMEAISPHILGMWFNFIVSVCLITYFVVKMSGALRQREQQLVTQREENLRDEQVLAVANLAAGTAHELGSPLTTMKVLLSEMEHDQAGNPLLLQDIGVLKTQVDQCSQTLKKLVTHSEVTKQDTLEPEWVADYCARLFEQWLIIRPDVKVTITIDPQSPAIKTRFHSTIDQAIINLLNNAGDASPSSVEVNAGWNTTQLTITINDRGPGISEEVEQQLGQAFVTTKGRGLGLGLFLSNATLNRYGGKLNFYARAEGGTRTEIIIPISGDVADTTQA